MAEKIEVLLICPNLPEGIGQLFQMTDEYGSGWISGMLEGMKKYPDVHFSYAVFRTAADNSIVKNESSGIAYNVICYHDHSIITHFLQSMNADIVHLYGIENEYMKDLVDDLDYHRTLIYIQGLASEYAYYYQAGCGQYFPAGLMFQNYLQINQKHMKNRGIPELKILSKAKFAAGRTAWDRAVLQKDSFSGIYYHLNESLRGAFYSNRGWNIQKIRRHSLLLSQGTYPIKGLHMAIEIVRILKRNMPDIQLYVGGEDLLHSNSPATRLGVSYASYIRKMISAYGLEQNIHFTGFLDAEQMADHMRETHVFLLASSIENSPNSLQEAMLVGAPCVSSNVGGINTIIENDHQCLLYPSEDIAQAAYQIKRVFENDELAAALSKEGQKRAAFLTNREVNAATLHDIYLDMQKRIHSERNSRFE